MVVITAPKNDTNDRTANHKSLASSDIVSQVGQQIFRWIFSSAPSCADNRCLSLIFLFCFHVPAFSLPQKKGLCNDEIVSIEDDRSTMGRLGVEAIRRRAESRRDGSGVADVGGAPAMSLHEKLTRDTHQACLPGIKLPAARFWRSR